jgi:hypothetical protein
MGHSTCYENSVLKGKRKELLVLIDKIHQQTSSRWYDMNSDDANSLCRLIGIPSLQHLNLILKAAGFMKHNSRSKSCTFCDQLFLDAVAMYNPLLTIPIKVQKMGQKKHWWILLGALGKAQSGPEQLADDKRMKKENETRPPQYLSEYLEQAIAEFVELNLTDSPEQRPFRTITPTTPASTDNQVAQVSPDGSIESQKGFEKDDRDDIHSTSKASEIKANESTRDGDNVDWKAKAEALGGALFQATNYLHSFVHCEDKMTNIEDVKDFLSHTAPCVVTPSNVLDLKQPPKLSTWFGTKTVEVGAKHKSMVAIPNGHQLERSQTITDYKKHKHAMECISEALKKKICCFNEESKFYLGAATAMTPKLSGAGSEIHNFAITKAVLTTLNIPYTDEQLLNALPCKATTEHYVEELAIHTHLVYSILLEEKDGRGIYLATDKADGSKVKKGCIKVLSKFCPSLANDEFPDGQLVIVVLDSDATGDDTEAVCKGIVKSIQKLPNGQVLAVVGTSSDSGGGGTVEKAKDNLVGKNVCDKYALVGNCTLHNMQLTGTVPMKHVFGAGGVGTRNIAQLLFLAYTVQSSLGRRMTRELLNDLKDNYEHDLSEEDFMAWMTELNDNPDMLLTMPNDARWWYTAMAVDRLMRNLHLWKRLAKQYVSQSNLTPVERDVGGNFVSLLEQPEVMVDLALLAGFFRLYLFSHFKFFQGVDPNVGRPGWLSFHVVTRFFLMLEDLNRLLNFQEELPPEMEQFEKHVRALPEDKQAGQLKKATTFFELAIAEAQKMFARWLDERLFFLAAFGEAPTANIVARFLLDGPCNLITEDEKESEEMVFESPLHQRTIDLQAFSKFIAKYCCTDASKLREFRTNNPHFQEYSEAFRLIADGLNVWDRSEDNCWEAAWWRLEVLIDYGGFPAATQFLERGNKNHNICASNGREERSINARMIVRSILIDVTNVTRVDEKREASSGRQFVVRAFKRLDDFLMALDRVRQMISAEEFSRRYAHSKSKLFEKDETFAEQEYQENKARFESTRDVERPLYAAERRRGYDVTPLMMGRVQYGKLRKIHEPPMKDELTRRAIPFVASVGIKTLCGILKNKLRDDWKSQNPGVAEKVYDEDTDKTMYFTPWIGAMNFKGIKIIQ